MTPYNTEVNNKMSRSGRRNVDGGRSSVRHQRSYADDEDDDDDEDYRVGRSRTQSHEARGVRNGYVERNRPSRRTVQTSCDTPGGRGCAVHDRVPVTSSSTSRGQSRTPSQRSQSRSPARSNVTRSSNAQSERSQSRSPAYSRSPARSTGPQSSPAQTDSTSLFNFSIADGLRSLFWNTHAPTSAPKEKEATRGRPPLPDEGSDRHLDANRSSSRYRRFLDMDVIRLPGITESDAFQLKRIGIHNGGDVVTIFIQLGSHPAEFVRWLMRATGTSNQQAQLTYEYMRQHHETDG